jgi:DNA polymerase III sliding clamp (beta) subunit (PCNA family)
MIIIPNALLRGASLFTRVDPNRPALDGILLELEVGRARLVATDGFGLFVAAIPGEFVGPDFTVLIPGGLIKALRPPKKGETVVDAREGKVTLSAGAASVSGGVLAATFPSWKRLLPAPGTAGTAHGQLAPEQLGRLAKLAQELGDDDLTISHGDGKSVAIYRGPFYVGVLVMQYRIEPPSDPAASLRTIAGI